MPRVSVVTASYNASAFVEETIDALLRQTFADFELIVVDDASRDDTAERVAKFKDPRIRLIRNPTNVGVARTRNIGVQTATGEYVAANDHDDVSLPTRLERQVAFLDANPDVLMVGAGIYTLANGKRVPDRIPAPEHSVLRWHLMTHVPICHSSTCARLARIREHQLFYEPALDFGDDFDLYHRMAAVGRLAALQERLVTYRLHAGNASIVSGADMNTRGSGMLLRAHERYLGMTLDPDEFSSLWRVVTRFSAARSEAELLLVGRCLEKLLNGYLKAMALSEDGEREVRRAASEQWWEAVARSSYVLGSAAYELYDRIGSLSEFRPTVVRRARQRIGRFIRTAIPSLAR